MRLTVIGCAGSVAGPHNPASCYLLEATHQGRTWRMVLDLGSGTLGPLQRVTDPARVDAVLISHGHVDHCADLAALSVWRRYGPSAGEGLPPIALWGPQGIDARLRQLEGSEDDAGLEPFDWSPLDAGLTRTLGPFTVTSYEAWHPVPALAYRISGPAEGGGAAVLTFTGDTDLSESVVEAARDADLLLAEAGWAHREQNPPGIHLTGAGAGELAARSGAKRLVVTHVASWVDPAATLEQARRAHASAVLAAPGVVFEV